MYVIWQLHINKAGIMTALWDRRLSRHISFHSASLYCSSQIPQLFYKLKACDNHVPYMFSEPTFTTACAPLCPCVSFWYLGYFFESFHYYCIFMWPLFLYFTNALSDSITNNIYKEERVCLKNIVYVLNAPLLCFFPTLQASLRHSNIGSRPLNYTLMASKCSNEGSQTTL